MGFSLIPTGTNIINDECPHAYEVAIRVRALVFEGFVHAGSEFHYGCAAAAPNTVNRHTKMCGIKWVGWRIADFADQLVVSLKFFNPVYRNKTL